VGRNLGITHVIDAGRRSLTQVGVFNRGVRAALTAAVIAAVLAGCGGGGDSSTQTAPPPTRTAAPPISTPQTSPRTTPTATTNTPPTVHRTTPQPSSTQPLTVGSTYKCGGRTLKTIDAHGPVVVQPKVVKPGQTFTVTVTAKNVHVAVVSLPGITRVPLQVNAKPQNGRLVATLKMPARAPCGNKLLEIEGDLTAEAFIGVS